MTKQRKPLNRKEVMQEHASFCKSMKLDQSEVRLGAGAALVMYKLRDATDDLDADVSEELFQKYLKSRKYNLKMFGETLILEMSDRVDIHIFDKRRETTVVDNIPCYSLKSLLEFKMELNREKDQEDIRKLKEALKHDQR